MKTNKSTTTAKVTPVTKGSKNLKAAPSAKAVPASKPKPAKVMPLVAPAPQDSATPPPAHSPDEVALRAYHNFQKRGSADGDHHGDWLQAEAELTAERSLVRA
ncbi:MAG: DUF2934 domain-containing protein [Verrucomicrobia bacterium]|nr:DUF2934 domain-containing protein [Verrucomicrobiota bacterium]